tara:strand:- start:850 stop:2448 length:1599 start_codon:yes stop_codon:yes gene_type:complete
MNIVTNSKNNSSLHILILFILFIFQIHFLNNNLYFGEDSIKHWSTYHRDDIVFVYNSLLYSENFEIHHLDHPSFFTYIFFSFSYKVFNFFGLIDFSNLTGFIESKNINSSLNQLFYISRLIIQFFSFASIILMYQILNKFSDNKLLSLLLAIIFIISVGFSSASNRIESGLIAIFFLLLAFYFFLKFIENKNKKTITYLALTFIFIFSAMLQKKIVYFAIPFLFISSLFLMKKNNIIYLSYWSIKNKNLYKLLLYLFFCVVIIFISYKTIINNSFHLSRDLDFIFLTVNFASLNILLFLYIKFFQENNYENLLTYNLILGITYFLYKYFLIYLFSAPASLWSISFTNFIVHLNMFTSVENIKGALTLNSLYIYFENFLSNIKLVIFKYLINYSFQTVLVWGNIILFFTSYKNLTTINKISSFFLLLGFFVMQSIFLFRYEQDTYFLNSELLLILGLSILLRNFISKKLLYILLLIFISLISVPTYNNFSNLRAYNNTSYCSDFDNFTSVNGYYEYWTNKIPTNVRKNFCKNF